MTMLLTLSESLLIRIRAALPHDLYTHIAFSQSCRRLRRLYVHDEAFWQQICFRAGFGRPLRKPGGVGSGNTLSWRRLTHVLVNHARGCQIRSCRNASGDMKDVAYYVHRDRDRNPGPADTVLFHPLYFYLHFAHLPFDGPAHAYAFDREPDTLSILLTLLPTFPECKSSQYGPLCSHPNASSAFATYPPMQHLCFQDTHGNVFLDVYNEDGCTILDVNRALAALIPQEFAALEVAHSHYYDLIRTSGLSKLQWADMVSKEKGFLGDHEYPFLQELIASA